jgi:hypothetical protein
MVLESNGYGVRECFFCDGQSSKSRSECAHGTIVYCE